MRSVVLFALIVTTLAVPNDRLTNMRNAISRASVGSDASNEAENAGSPVGTNMRDDNVLSQTAAEFTDYFGQPTPGGILVAADLEFRMNVPAAAAGGGGGAGKGSFAFEISPKQDSLRMLTANGVLRLPSAQLLLPAVQEQLRSRRAALPDDDGEVFSELQQVGFNIQPGQTCRLVRSTVKGSEGNYIGTCSVVLHWPQLNAISHLDWQGRFPGMSRSRSSILEEMEPEGGEEYVTADLNFNFALSIESKTRADEKAFGDGSVRFLSAACFLDWTGVLGPLSPGGAAPPERKALMQEGQDPSPEEPPQLPFFEPRTRASHLGVILRRWTLDIAQSTPAPVAFLPLGVIDVWTQIPVVLYRLKIQPVRLAVNDNSRLCLKLPGTNYCFFTWKKYSGAALSFGQPMANSLHFKHLVKFQWLPWKTISDPFGVHWVLRPDNDDVNPPIKDEANLRALVNVDDAVEVFFINTYDPVGTHGGGATWGSGKASAKIITTDELLECGCDKAHLAHELGHVLGLGHPGEGSSSTLTEATPGTVMCPSGHNRDNPRRTSMQNRNLIQNPLLTAYLDFISLAEWAKATPDCTNAADCKSCGAQTFDTTCVN